MNYEKINRGGIAPLDNEQWYNVDRNQGDSVVITNCNIHRRSKPSRDDRVEGLVLTKPDGSLRDWSGRDIATIR